MDSDILKSLAAFLITAACIIGPTILEALRRRAKAGNAAPGPAELSRRRKTTVAPDRPTQVQAPAPARMPGKQKPAKAGDTAGIPDSAPTDVRIQQESPRISALRKAVIASEILNRRF